MNTDKLKTLRKKKGISLQKAVKDFRYTREIKIPATLLFYYENGTRTMKPDVYKAYLEHLERL